MTEETLFENALFREKMSEIGLALIWITPGWDQKWDITAGSQKAFEQMLDDFASVSGYNELKYAPIVPFGHSAMATYPWCNFFESRKRISDAVADITTNTMKKSYIVSMR